VLSAEESFKNEENGEVEDNEIKSQQPSTEHSAVDSQQTNVDKNRVVPPESRKTVKKVEFTTKKKTSDDFKEEGSVGGINNELKRDESYHEKDENYHKKEDYHELEQEKYDGKEKLEPERDDKEKLEPEQHINNRVQEEYNDESESSRVGKKDKSRVDGKDRSEEGHKDASKDNSLEDTEGEEGKEIGRVDDDGGDGQEKKSIYLLEEEEPEYGM